VRLALALAAVACISVVTPVRATSPSLTFQRDSCLVTCPAGDSVFTIRSLKISGVPVAGADMLLDFSLCPGVVIPEAPPGSGYFAYPQYRCAVAPSDTSGSVAFPLAAGGISVARIEIYASGLYLGFGPPVASFDQNADLLVDQTDLALVEAKIGTTDPTADFDCDHAVTSADLTIAAGHLGHYHWKTVGVGHGPRAAFRVNVTPNPARGNVEFLLQVPEPGRAEIAVFDVSGRRLATVLDGEVEPGSRRIPWAGLDIAVRPLPAGVYLYRAWLGSLDARGALILTH